MGDSYAFDALLDEMSCKPHWVTQVTGQSEISTDLPGLDADCGMSRQCSDACHMTSLVEQAIKAAVVDLGFCATIGDPRGDDVPLIAVSKEFEMVTGYSLAEIEGKNCRFLSHGCNVDHTTVLRLRAACQKGGDPFTGSLVNRRKSGELFLNYLDLRPLTVATKPSTGEEIWYLVGIQADVSDYAEDEDSYEDPACKFRVVEERIKASITKELAKALRPSEVEMSHVQELQSWEVTEQSTMTSPPAASEEGDGDAKVEDSGFVQGTFPRRAHALNSWGYAAIAAALCVTALALRRQRGSSPAI